MRILKFLVIGILSLSLFSFWLAEDDVWTLIPETSQASQAGIIWLDPGKVWKNYNMVAKNMEDIGWSEWLWWAFKSWVFSWNLLFDYFKYIAKLLSQIGLVIWAAMIIYAGYKYAMWVFTQDTSKGWKDAIKWAIYGLLIVIFSYAIMRILLAMFW